MAITTRVRKAGDKKGISLETTIPKEIVEKMDIKLGDTLVWYGFSGSAKFIKFLETKEK